MCTADFLCHVIRNLPVPVVRITLFGTRLYTFPYRSSGFRWFRFSLYEIFLSAQGFYGRSLLYARSVAAAGLGECENSGSEDVR